MRRIDPCILKDVLTKNRISEVAQFKIFCGLGVPCRIDLVPMPCVFCGDAAETQPDSAGKLVAICNACDKRVLKTEQRITDKMKIKGDEK